MSNSSAVNGKQKVHNLKPRKEKKPFTFLAKSIITVLVLMAVEGFLVLALSGLLKNSSGQSSSFITLCPAQTT